MIKKIVFVAHEFGLYPGHGGIATYLYNICKYLLQNTDFNISVIASTYDSDTDLLKNKNFSIYSIKHGSLDKKRKKVFKIIKKIQPDYVEFAEFLALGLYCVLDKHNNKKNFQNTIFVTNNHTATKEIFVWSSEKPFEYAPVENQKISYLEGLQLKFSDYCIAPSNFLCKYVKKNYQLIRDLLWFMNPFFTEIAQKNEIINKITKNIELQEYKNTFNITLITRFEGRKCQDRLVNSFKEFINYPGVNAQLFLAGNSSSLPDSGKDYRYELFTSIPNKIRKYIHIYDFLSQKQQEPFVAITDLVVMPSTFENQPMAMIETVLRGIPIIASKYSGCADYIQKDMLFDPFDKDDLTNKIYNFYKLSKDKQIKIAKEQKDKLQKILDPSVCILPRFSLNTSKNVTLKQDLSELYHE